MSRDDEGSLTEELYLLAHAWRNVFEDFNTERRDRPTHILFVPNTPSITRSRNVEAPSLPTGPKLGLC
jgi:hypothetical protein